MPGSSISIQPMARHAEPRRPRLEGRRLSNDLVEVTLGPNGGLASLRLCGEPGREFVVHGTEMGLLRVYPDNGDAWDTPLDYQRHPTLTPEVASAREIQDGPDAGFEVELRCGESRVLQRLRLRAGSPLVFFDLEIDRQSTGKLLRVVFPCDVPAARASYEIQFGWLERANQENTSWDAARHECAHQQWVDLSNGGTGVAVLNDGKYGSVIKGQTVEMSLLRSVPYPGYDGQGGGSARNPQARFSGLGPHRCGYAVLPHLGHAAAAGCLAAGARVQPAVAGNRDGRPAGHGGAGIVQPGRGRRLRCPRLQAGEHGRRRHSARRAIRGRGRKDAGAGQLPGV